MAALHRCAACSSGPAGLRSPMHTAFTRRRIRRIAVTISQNEPSLNQDRGTSMRIAVIGAGGVGGAFGAALAKAGADVTFVARGAHLAAMRQNGLRVEGGRGETHLLPTQATDKPETIGPVDLVLFCVKLWDVESAGEQIRPIVGPNTAVIPLPTGADCSERPGRAA